MKEKFEEWAPTVASRSRVEQCEEIINEYQAQGLKLTLRQLYYQFVSRGLIPNTDRSYKNLGSIVSRARVAGMLDWDAIEDRGRRPDTPNEFDDPGHLVEVALRAYRLDRWAGQTCYAELWVEKAALAGVLEPLASEFHVTLMVNKGYSSQSAMYESAQRITNGAVVDDDDPRPVYIFYLGDHDPSGQDMVRDIQDRLNLYTHHVIPITVETVALTTKQVRQYRPPPNPTKLTDSRAKGYLAKHGHECWEVDALDPSTLQALIRDAFETVIDVEAMDRVKKQENVDKARLRKLVLFGLPE